MLTRRKLVFALALSPFAARSGAAENVPGRSPEALLRFVYGHYAGKGRDAKTFEWNRKPLVDALFEPVVARAIVQDTPTGEVGRLDFDAFMGAQDFKIASYKLASEEQSADQARVVASFKSLGQAKRVQYALVRNGGRWQIHDIRWDAERPSLRKLLDVPL